MKLTKKERERRCGVRKIQIEELHIAIEEDSKMKQLSKINPVSMIDFYKRRVSGQDDTAIGVVTKVRKLDANEAARALEQEAMEIARKKARVEASNKRREKQEKKSAS